MSRSTKKPVGNGFLALIVMVLFAVGIATMLVSGYKLNPANRDDEKQTSTDSTQTADVVSSPNSVKPNAFEEVTNLPDDYEIVSVINDDVHKGSLILVNYQYESKIDGENLVNIYDNATGSYTVKDNDMLINKAVMDNMNSLFDAFENAKGGTNIFVSSSYRSKSDQEEIYRDSVESTGEKSTAYYVSVPGYSEHQTGYCFDTATVDYNGEVIELDGEGVYGWLIEKCDDYGFILRYPADKTNITGIGYESWHFRYVGRPQSHFIHENNLCLEEYIIGMQNYTFENGGLIITDGDSKWITYYVPKLEAFNTTEIPVPKNCSYTISGDNVGGFIVTCDVTNDKGNSLLKTSTDKWEFDNSGIVIKDFEDYDPEKDDFEPSQQSESDTDSDSAAHGDNRDDAWESDSYWDDESSSEYDSDFEYVDYYDDYDENYTEDYGDGYTSQDNTYSQSVDYPQVYSSVTSQ